MLEILRERLLTVQLDLSSGLKTLGDKSKDAKIKKIRRSSEPLPKFRAGLELLSRYEDHWEAIHRGAMDCAKAGELIDSEVVMLSAHWERKKTGLVQLHEQLQQIPVFLADLESSTLRLTQLEKGFEEMENQLLDLEELCEQCELVRLRHLQYLQLENYKKKKRKELENFKADLDLEHNQKVLNMEHAQQMKLKERQKFFEEAFQEDMEQYLSTGYLQIAKGRDPIGSMSSMEVNVDMLEQMDLMDMSDQEALDVFLNSGEDKAVLSPCLVAGKYSSYAATGWRGADMENLENEITIQVPSQLELRQKLSSMSSNQTDLASQEANEEGGSPIIQSDEDEVHVDTALAVIGTNENANSDISDESDSQTV